MKKNAAAVLLAATLVVLHLALASPAAAGKHDDDVFPLEGKTLSLTLVPGERSDEKRDAQPIQETITFHAGTATLTAFAANGFPSVPYKLEKKGKKWLFTVEVKSATAGTLTWNGDYREEWFEGIVIWKRKDARELNYSFSVKRPKEPRAK